MQPHPDTLFAMRRAEHPHLIREAARDHQAALAQGDRQTNAIGYRLSAIGLWTRVVNKVAMAGKLSRVFAAPIADSR